MKTKGTLVVLLFIRAVDHPISHAGICLSKITFLLMSVNVSRLCRVIDTGVRRLHKSGKGENRIENSTAGMMEG